MQAVINGKQRDVPDGATLLQVLKHLDIDPRAVVVEHNREIVRRDRLHDARVGDGDEIEVVHFVGGG